MFFSMIRLLLVLWPLWIWALAQGWDGQPPYRRWDGQPEYHRFVGASTSAGPSLDQSYALIYPAQASFKGTLILVPGILGGATSFDALARRMVNAAPGWEVWAWDRRANGLEDRQGLTTPDPWAYYQKLQLHRLDFLKDWGLRVHLQDLDRVVEQARTRGRVVLGGHSLGANLASIYALSGGQKLSGLVLLDGSSGLVRLSQEQYLNGGQNLLGPTPGLRDLEAGKALPYISLLGLGPLEFAQAEAQAWMAAQAPLADAPPGWAAWPSSRMAAALSRIDDHYQPVNIFAVSVGRAQAREAISLISLLLGNPGYAVRGPRVSRVEWLDSGEATDPLEFLSLYATPQSGFSEWFFPYRLSLDLSAWSHALPELKPQSLPYSVLALGAGRGLLRQSESFAGLKEVFPGTRVEVQILPDLSHLDILTGRTGPAAGPIAGYLP
jgi:pimeloyl-ACP methyl ester carboxylesterase